MTNPGLTFDTITDLVIWSVHLMHSEYGIDIFNDDVKNAVIYDLINGMNMRYIPPSLEIIIVCMIEAIINRLKKYPDADARFLKQSLTELMK